MPVRRSDQANIGKELFAEQGSDPSAPASGKQFIYVKSAGLFVINSAGTVTGPLATSTVSGLDDLTNVTIISEAQGDILVRDNTEFVNLAIGTNGQVLTSDGTDAAWATPVSGVTDHGALTGLSDDDHSIYPLLVGRSGGQSLTGGTGSGDDLTLLSTSNATKGLVQILDPFLVQPATDSVTAIQFLDADGGNPVFNVDTVNERVGIGTDAPSALFNTSHASGESARYTVTDAGTPSNFFTFYDAGGRTAFMGMSSSGGDDFSFQNDTASGNIIIAALGGNVNMAAQGGLIVGEFSKSAFSLRLTAQNAAAKTLIVRGTTSQTGDRIQVLNVATGVNFGIRASNSINPLLYMTDTETLTAGVGDGYTSGVELHPQYDAAFTVTRHNYLNILTPTLTTSAVVTDAALARFDAAAGTHAAVDSGTTKTTPGSVDAWVKININGTIYYVPAYTSKTT